MKKTALLTLSIVTTSVLLSACGNNTTSTAKTDTTEISTTEIELEVAVPDTDTDTNTDTNAGTESKTGQAISILPWIQLGELDTHPELRQAMEEQLGITVDDAGVKEGILYIDTTTLDNTNNSTLFMAMQNSAFTLSILADEEALASLGSIAAENYTDIEPDDLTAPYAAINAYFELLPDTEEGVFDGDVSISRAQAMALVMRATTPVNEQGAPEINADFTSAVGASQYTDFAAPMNEYAYINTSNGLNTQTFDSTMSRGEYISLLTNLIFADYEDEIPEVTLTSLTDAGDISYTEAISDTTNGVPSDMYNTLKKAIALGIIDEDKLDWDSAITKADAVQLLVNTITVHNSLTSYKVAAEESWGSGYTLDEDGGVTYDGSKDTDGGEDYASYLEYQWQDNEAYKQAGCSSNSEFVETYAPGQGTSEAWRAYAQQNGADSTLGVWWIYYHGYAAGDEKSYAINQQTGERLEAGPNTFFPNGEDFWGYADEYQSNMEAYILSQ